ncbi:MAG: hypothetical protein ABIP51_18015 [Bacteroidia bacterium]
MKEKININTPSSSLVNIGPAINTSTTTTTYNPLSLGGGTISVSGGVISGGGGTISGDVSSGYASSGYATSIGTAGYVAYDSYSVGDLSGDPEKNNETSLNEILDSISKIKLEIFEDVVADLQGCKNNIEILSYIEKLKNKVERLKLKN